MTQRTPGGDAGLRQKAAVLTCVIAIMALLLGALFGDRGYLHLLGKREQVRALAHDVERLEAENAALFGEFGALRTDGRAIERIAREELGLAAPGEKVFIVPSEGRNSEH
jgi:cell division protein FtsB